MPYDTEQGIFEDYDDKDPGNYGLKDDDVCWADQVGDRWEAEGVDPGRIFEFHTVCVGADALPGGMLETQRIPPGELPFHWSQIKRVLILVRTGEGLREEEMPVLRPVVMAHFFRIISELC